MQFELLPAVPAVVLARQLRATPLFGFTSVDELFRIAAIARQARYAPGRAIQEKGAVAEYMQVLVEGEAAVEGEDGTEELVGPPAVFGYREVLEGVPLRRGVVAREESICLVLGAEDFRALLADNIEIATGLFRTLLGECRGDRPPSLLRGVVRPDAPEVAATSRGEAGPVERSFVLRAVPLFRRATADELLALGHRCEAVRLAPGETVFREGSPPAIDVVLAGAIALEPAAGSGPAETAQAGDVLGVHETLADATFCWRGRATDALALLRLEREPLFELLADEPDLLQALFAALFETRAVAEVAS